MNQDKAFYYDGATLINKQRIEHLQNLKLNFKNKTILETGCGGKGDITSYLLTQTNNITLNDARLENILSLKQNINKDLLHNTWDLNNELPLVEKFDIIVCYGTLYHLHKPDFAIKNLATICKEFMILSTAGNGKNNSIRFLDEKEEGAQSFTHKGCRPGRKWVENEFKQNFKYVYFPLSQPNHSDFKKSWISPNPEPCRFIIIGSHIELNNPNLTTTLPTHYK